MEPLEVAQAYFDAWNLRGPAEVAATFATGGTYADPTTGQPLSEQAIVEYTAGWSPPFRTFWGRASHRRDGRIGRGRLHRG